MALLKLFPKSRKHCLRFRTTPPINQTNIILLKLSLFTRNTQEKLLKLEKMATNEYKRKKLLPWRKRPLKCRSYSKREEIINLKIKNLRLQVLNFVTGISLNSDWMKTENWNFDKFLIGCKIKKQIFPLLISQTLTLNKKGDLFLKRQIKNKKETNNLILFINKKHLI